MYFISFSCNLPILKTSLIIPFILSNIKMCSPQTAGNPADIYKDFVPRVVNGWPAKLGDVPYQVSFKMMNSRYRNIYSSFCGGVLIGPAKLVSAAHCFEEKGSKCFNRGAVSQRELDKMFVVAGNLRNAARYSSKDGANGQWRRLAQMKYPSSYRFPTNDISVGFTTKPFVSNEHVAPIGFATQYADYRGKCLVSGYGRISNTQSSSQLLLGHLELMPVMWCNRVHRRNMRKFICTSDTISDVGKGDSGGPLVCAYAEEPNNSAKGILVGIVSGHRERAGSFFTRVSTFSKFIARGGSNSNGPHMTVVWVFLIYDRILLSLFCFI